MSTTESSHPLLHSELANDEDMVDLLESFVEQLPSRADAMHESLDEQDLPRLQVLAHQLKGAAGSYGFAPISEACRDLEASIARGAGANEIRKAIGRVAELCSRATAAPA